MIKTKKYLSLILCVSILLSGCGKISNNANKNETSSSEKNTEEPTTQPITTIHLTPKKEYYDGQHRIKFMGMKEYKKVESEKFTDIPKKGKVYLIIFFECTNDSEYENLYINEANIASAIDDKKIEHTVIFNDPEGYPTLFRNIEPNTQDYGFVVWEVPENWKKMDLVYTGFEGTNQNKIKMSFSKEDLVDPPKYEDAMPR